MRIKVPSLIPILLAAGFTAQVKAQCTTGQISPNPNLFGNTIGVIGTGCNALNPFDNFGAINVGSSVGSGTLNNTGTLNNNSTGTITLRNSGFNTGVLNNDGVLNNYGTLIQQPLTSMANTGVVNNYGIHQTGAGPGGALVTNLGTYNNNQGAQLWISPEPYAIWTNTIGATLNNRGTITSDWQLLNYGTVNNSGLMTSRNGSAIDNSGTINNNSGGTLLAPVGGTISNRVGGTINNNGGTIDAGIASALVNNGTVINNGGTVILRSQTSPAAINGTGTYYQTDGVTINNGGMIQGAVHINGGLLEGYGRIEAPVTVNGGTISPATVKPSGALDITTLAINGNLTFNSGLMLFEIGGTGIGQFDVLAITGRGSFLSGTIGFSFIDGYLPTLGDQWLFLTAGDGVRGFENLNFRFAGVPDYYDFDVIAGDRGLMLNVAAIPEPEIYAMMMVGLGVLSFVARRRRKAG